MKIRVLPSAIRDLEDGFEFYERQEPGAGGYFVDSIASDIGSLRFHAGIHRKRGEHFRVSSKRFPYWIYYRLEDGTVYVAAVLDARRHPGRILAREREMDADD